MGGKCNQEKREDRSNGFGGAKWHGLRICVIMESFYANAIYIKDRGVTFTYGLELPLNFSSLFSVLSFFFFVFLMEYHFSFTFINWEEGENGKIKK